MNNVHENLGSKKSSSASSSAMEPANEGFNAIRERVEQARDMFENVKEKAEITFKEKPYLVPVTAGAVGFGIGLLFGSKLVRFVAFTAVGALVTDALGGEIKRISSDFMGDLKSRLAEGEE
jgi:hypothetical protein